MPTEKIYRTIYSLTHPQKIYLDNVHKQSKMSRAKIIRFIINDFMMRSPTGELFGAAKGTRVNQERISTLQTVPPEEIVENMPQADISSRCNYPECNDSDTKNFNRIIEYQDKDEIITELELVTTCVSHYNYYINDQGWKLELLD